MARDQSAYNAAYYIENRETIRERRQRIVPSPRRSRKKAKPRSEMTPEQLAKIRMADRAKKIARRVHKKLNGRFRWTIELRHDVARLLDLQEQKCAALHCRKDIKEDYHVDHVMPVFFGGSNESHNLQLLCPLCNRLKADKHPNDWMPTMWWAIRNRRGEIVWSY